MIYDLDVRRENIRLRAEIREREERAAALKELVLTLLEAPYEGLVPWARTLACSHPLMGHPTRKSDGRCYCDPRRVARREEDR